jgi:soluble lytic murein transglycosylase
VRRKLILLAALLGGAAMASAQPAAIQQFKNAAKLKGNAALPGLRAALPQLKPVQDYIAYFIATAQSDEKDYLGAARTAEAALKTAPSSPVEARLILLAARSYLKAEQPELALRVAQARQARLTSSQFQLIHGQCLEALGREKEAAEAYLVVWIEQPRSAEAPQAEPLIAALRAKLGAAFPEPSPKAKLDRALRLLEGNEATKARRELEAVIPQLRGADAELARLKSAVAAWNARQPGHLALLQKLQLTDPALDAERWNAIAAAARRMKANDMLEDALANLYRSHAASPWRLDALSSTGSYYYSAREFEMAQKHWRTCSVAFAGNPAAAFCDWKAAFGDYLARKPNARAELEEHITRYPDSPNASAALYYLGRLAEMANRPGDARVYYAQADKSFPQHYYSMLCRERLKAVKAGAPATVDLSRIAFPVRQPVDFTPNAETQFRLGRARVLDAADLDDFAELELRYAVLNKLAYAEGEVRAQPHLIAAELATIATKRNQPERALRAIKGLFPAYLNLPVDGAPDTFWRLAFPIGHKSQVEFWAKERALDLPILAGLIRQESEYDAKALSRARAMGLTQVMPSTGRQLARTLGIKRFTTQMLFQPETNLKMGTYYLRSLWDSLDKNWEEALASYNGGKSRVVQWRTWFDYREPAEFVESIPFTETRGYVQAILRNAEMYRRLYGSR